MKLVLKAIDAAPLGAAAAQVPVLRALSLTVAAQEAVAVIGPSGAGKTTLLHVLACALRPSAGQYELGGSQPWSLGRADLRALRGQLFLAPQVPPLPPRQRVVTAVLAGCLPTWTLARSLRSLVYPSDLAAAHAALASFDLAEKLFERVDRLSGGERQRVGLARALVTPAKLWLLDEPLSALDPLRTEQAAQALVQQARERGVTLVASLHHVEMALAHFPRIIGLRQGQVLFDLPAAEVSRALLAQLYAQHEDELDAGLAPPPELGSATRSVLMTCR